MVVVAAGNNGRDDSMGTKGYATITSPANTPEAITVGAMRDMATTSRSDDLIASYSSKGPTLIDHVRQARSCSSREHYRVRAGAECSYQGSLS